MALAIPPIDIILFFCLWGIFLIAWAVHEAKVRFKLCNNNKIKAATPSSAADETLTHPEAPTNNNSSPTPFWHTSNGRSLRRALLYVLGGFAVSWILTCIIFAILGATGVLDMFLFAPKTADECSASCHFYSEDGLNGWVDEACCTYDYNVGQQDVWLRRGTDDKVHGYLLQNKTLAHSGQKPLYILYNHGSGGNVASGYRYPRYEFYLSLGNVILFTYDYAGYGKSTGSTSVSTVTETALIATRWFNGWLRDSATSLGNESSPVTVAATADSLNLTNVTVMGRSMGGAVATYIEAQSGNTSPSLALQSTFSNVYGLALAYFPMFGWVLKKWATDDFEQFSNTKNLEHFSHCLYHSHSENDEWVPYAMAEEIERAVESKQTKCSEFLTIEDAKHTQPLTNLERIALTKWLNSARNSQT
eukprot:PhM_4_TR417/c2_g2_i1/m.48431/K13704/ABHD12; abhydrolase domain-containing protein 12